MCSTWAETLRPHLPIEFTDDREQVASELARLGNLTHSTGYAAVAEQMLDWLRNHKIPRWISESETWALDLWSTWTVQERTGKSSMILGYHPPEQCNIGALVDPIVEIVRLR